jgi:hypothetical protein
VTANTYLHATESLQQLHAERIDEALEGAVSELSDAEAGKSALKRELQFRVCHEAGISNRNIVPGKGPEIFVRANDVSLANYG